MNKRMKGDKQMRAEKKQNKNGKGTIDTHPCIYAGDEQWDMKEQS